MTLTRRRKAILSPVAWRTPPRQFGAWETVAGNIAGRLVATGRSTTRASLHAAADRGYEEDRGKDTKAAEYLHISEVFDRAAKFHWIHSNYDSVALSYTRLVKTPVLSFIYGFSSPRIYWGGADAVVCVGRANLADPVDLCVDHNRVRHGGAVESGRAIGNGA